MIPVSVATTLFVEASIAVKLLPLSFATQTVP